MVVCSGADARQPNPEDAYLNSYISGMESRYQGAFITECVAKSATANLLATVIYFPRKNSGMFVLRAADGHVSNMGSVRLSDKGQWDLSDLEGGMDTIRILSNLFLQLVRFKFVWVAPSDLGHVGKSRPQNTCRLLGNEGYNPIGAGQ